jgi:hypothetical protein
MILTAIMASLMSSADCFLLVLDDLVSRSRNSRRPPHSATTTSLSAPDHARKQTEIKHFPPLVIYMHQVEGTGAPEVAAVVASPMPSRCSLKSPGHYINSGHVELMFARAVKLSSPSSSLVTVIPGLH